MRDGVEPRPAATVVLARPTSGDGGSGALEVLLTRRPSTMAFAADMQVFPGGRVDPADADPRLVERSGVDPVVAAMALGGDLDPIDAHATFIAAIREAWEEVGVLLAETPADLADLAALEAARTELLGGDTSFAELAERLDLRLRTDLLVPLSRWVTPPTLDRRFDARFFVAALPDGSGTSLVGEEVTTHDWWTPRAALDAMADGRLGMWLPTSATLQQLEHAGSVEVIHERLTPRPLGPVAVDTVAEGVVRVVMPAGGGIAGQPVCAYVVGRREVVVVDPGDPTGPGLDAILEVVAERGARIVAVALTTVEPDHAAGAEAIAEMCDVGVMAAPARARDVPYPVEPLENDLTLRLGDVPITAVATPGPTPDHVAFVVGEGTVVLSGDLDGVRGARSIPGPVDDAASETSRARLRALASGARWLGGHPPR